MVLAFLTAVDTIHLATGSRQAYASGGGCASATRDAHIHACTGRQLAVQASLDAEVDVEAEREAYDDWIRLCDTLRDGGWSPDD